VGEGSHDARVAPGEQDAHREAPADQPAGKPAGGNDVLIARARPFHRYRPCFTPQPPRWAGLRSRGPQDQRGLRGLLAGPCRRVARHAAALEVVIAGRAVGFAAARYAKDW